MCPSQHMQDFQLYRFPNTFSQLEAFHAASLVLLPSAAPHHDLCHPLTNQGQLLFPTHAALYLLVAAMHQTWLVLILPPTAN